VSALGGNAHGDSIAFRHQVLDLHVDVR
jgi:hypothetical protein